ncbi:late competence development ComFB family protein [Aneurinibacillus sp. Ricciae_BoGa-3]|uniref:late competence development ComFB family protein n=1 Tax=Aneurinibacillus sp. Ricciae_BoGa-3 TaxID=3022697 RepID=UPI002341EE78|nr:late competence development ComFB family protein [Aneurinibacillus sp. Ricciae_BoGa-3]WCK54245.1 late competence development ComFB family protein [Aneurinibacillus sp. Ricciae_BoGa-3]
MSVINAMENVVKHYFSEFEERQYLKCNCEHCKNDILAIALNQLPSKYVSTAIGEVYMKTLMMDKQVESDVLKEITNAAMIVEKNPHHN